MHQKNNMIRLVTYGIVVLTFVSCRQWEIPADLVGEWESRQKVKVRTKEKGKFVFISAPDSVLLKFTIMEDGTVKGNLGSAVFKNSRVRKNRGEIGKKLRLATDFVIKGELKGPVFPGDPNLNKIISIPFDESNGQMRGSIFQMYSIDLYPMSGFDAIKQN